MDFREYFEKGAEFHRKAEKDWPEIIYYLFRHRSGSHGPAGRTGDFFGNCAVFLLSQLEAAGGV